MAQPFNQLCLQCARAAGRGAVTLAFWTLWLGLVLLLAGQIYVASTNELPVPRFVQHALEERLALSGIRAKFGRTMFDPSGRVLIEDVRITLPGFEEPAVTARAIYARLDPWALLVDRFEPLDLRVTGVSLRVPAMFSPSGQADEIVRDLDAAFLPHGNELTIEYCNGHLGNLAVCVGGGVRLGGAATAERRPLPIAQFLAESYGQLSRQGAGLLAHLGGFDQPRLQVQLAPAEPNGATAQFVFSARGCRLDPPAALEASGLRIEGSYAPGAGPMELLVAAEQVALPRFGAVARGLQLRLRGREEAAKSPPAGLPTLVLREVAATAATLTGLGQTIQSPILWLRGSGPDLWSEALPKTLDPVRGGLQAVIWGHAISAQGEVDFRRGSARGTFAGAVGPAVLDSLGAHWHRDFHPYAALDAPVQVVGEARFDPGWKFAGVSARVDARGVTYKSVKIDEARGRIEFDGRHLVAPEAFARIGPDFARGSYEMDVVTKDYRYLLAGRLRPLDITPWINGAWWPIFFGNFAFPSVPPTASVDLRGCYVNPLKVEVLVFFDGADTVALGVPFDRVRTRLFIRPQFDDGLEFSVTRGAGEAHGTFARRWDVGVPTSQKIDFDVTSTLDPGPIIRDAAAIVPASLAAYAFSQPPTLKVSGSKSWPDAPGGPHLALHVDARTDGEFRYDGFPFDGVTAVANLLDEQVSLPQVAAGFAGGRLSGHAQLSGQGAERRLAFDGALAGANLGRAITVVETFAAQRAHRPPPPLSNFLKDKSDLKLDVSAAAEGRLADLYSYRGGGSVTMQGGELGELRMLGLLSDLLPFTSLRFTSARSDFKVEEDRLVFPNISVVGANSEITANGTYSLERHLLDFRAKIQPFQKSTALPQLFMGAFLTPFSTLFQVKLAGTIDKPSWSLANGLPNLLRNLGPGDAGKPSVLPPLSPLKEN